MLPKLKPGPSSWSEPTETITLSSTEPFGWHAHEQVSNAKEAAMRCNTYPLMLEALQNLVSDDRKSMPPSAWQRLGQDAIKAAGGVPKPVTTPAADWGRARGEDDPHEDRYECERHQTEQVLKLCNLGGEEIEKAA